MKHVKLKRYSKTLPLAKKDANKFHCLTVNEFILTSKKKKKETDTDLENIPLNILSQDNNLQIARVSAAQNN